MFFIALHTKGIFMVGKAKSEKINYNVTPDTINNYIRRLKKNVAIGEELLRHRPIQKGIYDNWDNTICDILKKSSLIDPMAVQRFLSCGKNGCIQKKSNEAFWENHRAMSVYDKLRILGYHLNTLEHELHFISTALEN